MPQQVSDKREGLWVSIGIQELVEGDIQVFLDGIEDGPNGQKRNSTGGGGRCDSRAFHIHGYGS